MIYKMKSIHYAPKGSYEAVAFFVNAVDESDLFEQVKESLDWDGRDEEYKEDYKNDIIRLKGDDDEEVTSFEDLYYGLTTFSWEECDDLTEEDFKVLTKAGLTTIER
jgi:hypothetical protein